MRLVEVAGKGLCEIVFVHAKVSPTFNAQYHVTGAVDAARGVAFKYQKDKGVSNRLAPMEDTKHVVVCNHPTPRVGIRAQVVFCPPVFARYPPAAEPPPRR